MWQEESISQTMKVYLCVDNLITDVKGPRQCRDISVDRFKTDYFIFVSLTFIKDSSQVSFWEGETG